MGHVASESVNLDIPDDRNAEAPTSEGVSQLVDDDGDEHHGTECEGIPDGILIAEPDEEKEGADEEEARLNIHLEAEDLKPRYRAVHLYGHLDVEEEGHFAHSTRPVDGGGASPRKDRE